MIPHDPGGKGRLPLLPGYIGSARFAGDNHEHRLWLSRVPVSRPVLASEYALWIGVNPSTAGVDTDDMTVRKDMGFSKRLGLPAYIKMNVASYRATDQKRFNDPAIEVNHPNNHQQICHFASACGAVVVATGNPHPRLRPLALDLFGMLCDAGIDMLCLGLTREGWPKHSSRIGYITEFEKYKPIR